MAALVRMSVALSVCLVLPVAIGFLWDKPPVTDTRGAITELENKWLQEQDDPDALQVILADDFIHVLPAGFVNKSEQLRYMRAHPVASQESRHFEDLRVRIYGKAAVANGIVVATEEHGRITKTIFTDVFALRNGKWQAVNAQETPLNNSSQQ